jgi:ferric-dicitrate binding protein FerR (iron transport regulator)
VNCREASDIQIYVETNDPSLSAADRAAFFSHIEACEACRQRYEEDQRLLELLREYGTLSPDTIGLPESHGEVVLDHLRPEPEEELFISDEEIETDLAKLMARIDEMEAAEDQSAASCQVDMPASADDVADLRRRVNTLEAYQESWREQWREHAGQDSGDRDDEAATQSSWSRLLQSCPDLAAQHEHQSRRHDRRRILYRIGGLAAAACLLLAVTWAWWQPTGSQQGPSSATAQQANASLELVTASGRQPLALGQAIRADDSVKRLLLGGQHKVMLNRNTTITVTAQVDTDHATPAWRIKLTTGELYADVVHGLPGGTRFAVVTPNALATITGTKFNIRSEGGATELTLLKGSVRFASPAADHAIDVTTGHASTITGAADPTTPHSVDALVAIAWTQPDEVAGGLAEGLAGTFDQPLLVDGLGGDALLPIVPDYQTWTYERFRDEMRPWFAEQFPWAIKLEKSLNEEHRMDADYLDVLVVSGDIWQFHYPVASGKAIPAFHAAGVQRLAEWYDFDANRLMHAVNQNLPTTITQAPHGTTYAAMIDHWQTDLTTNISADQVDDQLMLFSMQAGTYLHRTRAAMHWWVQRYPIKAERLINQSDYHAQFIGPLLDAEPSTPITQLQDRLIKQMSITRYTRQLTQQWAVSTQDSRVCRRPHGPVTDPHVGQMLLQLTGTDEE